MSISHKITIAVLLGLCGGQSLPATGQQSTALEPAPRYTPQSTAPADLRFDPLGALRAPAGSKYGTLPQSATGPLGSHTAAAGEVNLYLSYPSSSQHRVDRIRRIMVLRQLLGLGFSSGDINGVLPLLRELQAISSRPPADPDAAIEQEYQELLRAAPGKPLPPSSAAKITDAATYYREEQRRIWTAIERKVGGRKAAGLRSLLGQDEQDGMIRSIGAPDR